MDSTDLAQLFLAAQAFQRAGNFNAAESCYQRLLVFNPDHVEALTGLGTLYLRQGHRDAGLRLIGRSLAINPDQPAALVNRGAALSESRRFDEALASYDRALALRPDSYRAHHNRGVALNELHRRDEALASYERAIELRPDFAEAHNNRGNVLNDVHRHDEALASYERAIALRPGYAEAYNNRGTVLSALTRYPEALASYERAIALRPDYAEAYYNRGGDLAALRRHDEALVSYERAIALRPDYAEAHLDRGNALVELRRHEEALASYERAIALRPGYAEAHINRGNLLRELERHEEALASYGRAIALRPDHDLLLGSWVHTRMHMCDWDGIERDFRNLLTGLEAGKTLSSPFALLAVPSSPAQQRICAERFAEKRFPRAARRMRGSDTPVHDRIRIGYFSADFHNHATGYLIAGLIEGHDRSRFEITGFSYGPSVQDTMRRRLDRAFDRLLDVRTLRDDQIVALAHRHEIDIAVDLKGYTANGRPGLFSRRPAPVQVSYLGYPGTMGVDWMDYLIADPVVIPQEHLRHYSEKIVWLPHSYQANDSKRAISDRPVTRREADLPEHGFVFCCFNNSYKLTPDVFDIWMRLLAKIEDSVLWLLEGNAAAVINLRKEAADRGVAPERLVFAGRMELSEHLARHRLADLFLDTLHYGAHTTASDALWAGLPVLTCLGETFAGRVAASLLTAIGLPEMIATSHGDYEALALELATHPEKLKAVQRKLEASRTTQPLFDTALFTREIEAAYMRMWQRELDRLPAEHFHVST